MRKGHLGRLFALLSSRLTAALAASVVTALVLGGLAIGTALPLRESTNQERRAVKAPAQPSSPSASAGPRTVANAAVIGASTTILGGSAAFADALDTTAYIGPDGRSSVHTHVGSVAWVLPVAGTLSSFNARLDTFPSGSVTFTVMLNGAATAITCTIAAPERRCAAAGSLVVPPQGAVAVRIQNATGSGLDNLRWAAAYVIPD